MQILGSADLLNLFVNIYLYIIIRGTQRSTTASMISVLYNSHGPELPDEGEGGISRPGSCYIQEVPFHP